MIKTMQKNIVKNTEKNLKSIAENIVQKTLNKKKNGTNNIISKIETKSINEVDCGDCVIMTNKNLIGKDIKLKTLKKSRRIGKDQKLRKEKENISKNTIRKIKTIYCNITKNGVQNGHWKKNEHMQKIIEEKMPIKLRHIMQEMMLKNELENGEMHGMQEHDLKEENMY